MKADHDMIFRDAQGYQFFGNRNLCPVVLNPYLFTLDIKVQHTAIDSMIFQPPNAYELVVIIFCIKYGLYFNPKCGGRLTGITSEQFLDTIPVLVA